jgi:hypothetical protein
MKYSKEFLRIYITLIIKCGRSCREAAIGAAIHIIRKQPFFK